MSSSASLPSPDDDYAAPLDARLNKAFWDAALKSVGARIRALEAVKADWEELINQGTGQALAVIQANVEPQLAALTAVINQLKAEVAAAEDAIAVIIAGGVNMSAVTGLADALAAKASLSALNGAVSALTLLMDDYVSHAEAQTLTAEQKAQALSNLGLEDIHKTLTPFGFTATAGQTTFDLGISPSPNACLFSLNGAWLTNGADYAVAGSTLTLSTPAEAGDRVSGVAIGSFVVANAMLPAANLSDLGDRSVARGNLGLGSAAVLDAGTGANQLLKLDGTGKVPVANLPGATLSSLRTPTGASELFSSIPAGIRKVTLYLHGLSLSGSAVFLVRLGTSSGLVTTGYNTYWSNTGANYVAGAGAVDGVDLVANAASRKVSGVLTFEHMGGDIWTYAGLVGEASAVVGGFVGGSVALGGTLTQLQVSSSNGTDLFDSGNVSLRWE